VSCAARTLIETLKELAGAMMDGQVATVSSIKEIVLQLVKADVLVLQHMTVIHVLFIQAGIIADVVSVFQIGLDRPARNIAEYAVPFVKERVQVPVMQTVPDAEHIQNCLMVSVAVCNLGLENLVISIPDSVILCVEVV